MKAHFEMMADYNSWANCRVFDAVYGLADEVFRRDLGAFFHSLHGTLNHIYVADLVWMSRFRGLPNPPWKLSHIAHDEPGELRRRREALDRDIIGYTGALTEKQLAAEFSYITMTDHTRMTQSLSPALAHFFNHQTHHRGQCHAMLTQIGADAPALDLVFFQREAAPVTAFSR
ncbi:MAG: DinB family protein [Pseudomonadota bacterium]